MGNMGKRKLYFSKFFGLQLYLNLNFWKHLVGFFQKLSKDKYSHMRIPQHSTQILLISAVFESLIYSSFERETAKNKFTKVYFTLHKEKLLRVPTPYEFFPPYNWRIFTLSPNFGCSEWYFFLLIRVERTPSFLHSKRRCSWCHNVRYLFFRPF